MKTGKLSFSKREYIEHVDKSTHRYAFAKKKKKRKEKRLHTLTAGYLLKSNIRERAPSLTRMRTVLQEEKADTAIDVTANHSDYNQGLSHWPYLFITDSTWAKRGELDSI